jgi:hypothetical protein
MTGFDGTQLTLSQSFRFGPLLAEEANRWLHLRGLAVSGQASDRLFHAAIRNFSYSAWTSRGGR